MKRLDNLFYKEGLRELGLFWLKKRITGILLMSVDTCKQDIKRIGPGFL